MRLRREFLSITNAQSEGDCHGIRRERQSPRRGNGKSYEFGFTTEIESDKAPAGLSEDIIRLISAKKEEPEWLLQWRLEAFAMWQTMQEPNWPHLNYEKPDYQAISYYAAPKQKKQLNSMDEVDPELRRTMDKLGISLEEQKRLSGVAVDFVMDSVSVATSFKDKLAELGIIFCSMSQPLRSTRSWCASTSARWFPPATTSSAP